MYLSCSSKFTLDVWAQTLKRFPNPSSQANFRLATLDSLVIRWITTLRSYWLLVSYLAAKIKQLTKFIFAVATFQEGTVIELQLNKNSIWHYVYCKFM